mmetsp:Transcript_10977/g.46114  ORF Transcript_10977/g.46114 Transcript_10977/m.46114 type:complete len:262 (-) Transcript_10977:626-1411(-)
METRNNPGNCLKPASSAVFLMNCDRRSTRTAMRNSLPASSFAAPMISKSRCAFLTAAREAPAAFSSASSSAGFGVTVATGERRDKPRMSGIATETSFKRAGDPDPEDSTDEALEGGSFSTVTETSAPTERLASFFSSSVFVCCAPRDRDEYPRRSFIPRSFMPTMVSKLVRLPCGVLGMLTGVEPPLGVLSPGTETKLSSLFSTPPAFKRVSSKKLAGASFSNGESSLHCSTSTSPSRSFTWPSFPKGARPPRCMATIAAP